MRRRPRRQLLRVARAPRAPPARSAGGPVVEVGIALVVEVVEQPGDGPALLVARRSCGRRRASRPRRASSVLAQRLGLGPLAERGPRPRRASSAAADMASATPSPAAPTMEKFVIEGGVPLSGRSCAAGNKNAALPILAACLLTEEEVVLAQRPADPRHRGAARAARATSAWRSSGASDNERRACAPTTSPTTDVDADARRADPRLVPARRPAAGPLRRGADAAAGRRRDRPPPARPAPRRLPRPRRRRSTHDRDDRARAPDGGLQPCRLLHGRAVGDGHRERADGRGADARADDDPQRRLASRTSRTSRACSCKMGAADRGHRLQRDDRPRPRRARRRRARDLRPTTSRSASFMALAAATGGELRIRDAEPDDLRMIRLAVRAPRAARSRSRATTCSCPPSQELRGPATTSATRSRRSRTGRGPRSRPTSPRSPLALATQAEGTILIFEKMFENRLFFVDKLVAMGARITLCDPHRAIVSGPSRLHGERVESPDIRAGMAMLIAALCADGHSRDRQHRARSTAATSGSTSACARSARGSSASRSSASPA